MSHRFIIRGGRRLSGTTEVRGSKNAASKMMIASLLTREECVIDNVPFSGETDITQELCEQIGSRIVREDPHRIRIATPEITTSCVPELSRKNRIPILALGPLLHRKGFAEVPVLGGCPIGHRPINFHLEALAQMGVRIERREHSYYAEADDIRGAPIELPYPSVGATENVILTAVRARGTTTITNAATEPEILNLIAMVNAMGAEIVVEEERRMITITGVTGLQGTVMRVIPDRNEIVSLAAAAVATKGEIFIPDIDEAHIISFLEALGSMGVQVRREASGITFAVSGPLKGVAIETGPHPAFMTDWQQPFAVVLAVARGVSSIHETVYEDRLRYAKDLIRMGAAIEISDECFGANCRFHGHTFNHSLRIHGPAQLHGTQMLIPDLRAGMAHIVAALAAEGESVISGVEHVDRGYENIDERLRQLGAHIERV